MSHIKGGGIDWTAVTTAWMKGWQTRTFVEKTCNHHRPMGTGSSRSQIAESSATVRGIQPWRTSHLADFPQRLSDDQTAVSDKFSLSQGAVGLGSAQQPPISPELVRFNRTEQMSRLKGLFWRVERQKTQES
jgi:hypothetical protein